MDLRNATTVGLDLGSSGFRAAELSWEGDRPTVARWAALDFDTEIDDWSKVDVVEIGDLVRSAMDKKGVRGQLAAHAVSGKSVVPQYFNFPQLMDEDVAEAVRIEVESGLPFRIEDTLFAYILFPDQRTVPGKARTHGLAIAAEGNLVEARLEIVRNAGLEPFCVETDATACANAFIATRPGNRRDGAAAILNIGHRYTNLTLLGNEGTLLMRDVPWAGAQLSQRIAERLGVEPQKAEELKRAHWEGRPSHSDELDVAMPEVLRTSVQELVARLRDTIHYWVSEHLVPALGVVFITGGGSQVHGLPELLSDALSVPVEHWSPVSGMVSPRVGGTETWDYRLTVAFGLALRKFERNG